MGIILFYGVEYTFHSLDELQKGMEECIDDNNQRITTKLKGLTPVEYRNQSLYINLKLTLLRYSMFLILRHLWNRSFFTW
ncbi:IS3 family transposase [Bulleidia sp. zg-1006]|nr:IS3 family transposase [Bulleidia sp. zg-1006]